MGALFSVVFLKLYWAYFFDHNKGSIVEVVLAIWCRFHCTSQSCLAPPLHQLICCRTPIQLFLEPTSKVVVFPFFPMRQTFKVLFLVVFFINIIQHSKCSYITTYKLCCGTSCHPTTEPKQKHIFLVTFSLFSLTPPFCAPWSPVKLLNSFCLHASLS